MFPDDATLIARGKYATLRRDKRQQLERIQATCATLITTAQGVLTECQAKAQDRPQLIVTLATCVENLTEARDKVITLNAGMAELENAAWPK